MSVPIRAEPVAHVRRRAARPRTRPIAGAAAIVALLTAGCSALPPAPLAGPHPADLAAGAPQTSYRSTIEPYASRRPVEPGPWREQNERVAPGARP